MIFFTLLFIIILVVKSIKRYKRLFNPFTLSIQIPLLFLTVPQTILVLIGVGEDSILSDSVILVFVICIYIGTFIKIPPIKIPEFKHKKSIRYIIASIIALLFVIMFPMLMSYGLSLQGIRAFYENIVFSPLASIYQVSKTLLSVLIIFLFIKSRKVTIPILIFVAILFLSGSKMAILSTAILLAVTYEEYGNINYKKLISLFIILFIFLIFYHYAQSIYAEDKGVLMNALSYFDVYDQQTKALNMFVNGELEYFHGDISLSSWYKIIPRFLWENKPKDYGFALLNYAIYPEYAASGWMPSFGLAYTFADFGFFSIISSGLIAGLTKNYLYKLFKKNNKSTATFLLYMFSIDIITFLLFTLLYFISSLKDDTSNNSLLLVK